MKALLALVIIYVGTFFIVVHGASQNSVKAAPQGGVASVTIDPAKEADIRSLMELLSVHDLVREAAAKEAEQFRESLVASVPNSDRGRQFANSFISAYQKKFNADDVANQLVAIYDKHFTEDEIRGLLQFYGSPLGQKYATEMQKIAPEIQATNRSVGTRVAKEVLQDLRKQYPNVSAQARLVKPRAGQTEQAKPHAQAPYESQASASQP